MTSSDRSPENQPDLREARGLARELQAAAEELEGALELALDEFEADQGDEETLDTIRSALGSAHEACTAADLVKWELRSIPQFNSESSATAVAAQVAE